MQRKIIRIDADRCTGCGLCAEACHERAIGMVGGKAVLLRDDYCDGLGDCLPACPTGAITFESREALPYDEQAVQANLRALGRDGSGTSGGDRHEVPGRARREIPASPGLPGYGDSEGSALRQWPVQLQLVPEKAPFFDDADVLLSADCCAYAHGNFHQEILKGRILLLACPKLDSFDFASKLGRILRQNRIRSLTIARMSVPCCGGLESVAKNALGLASVDLPTSIQIITPQGRPAL